MASVFAETLGSEGDIMAVWAKTEERCLVRTTDGYRA